MLEPAGVIRFRYPDDAVSPQSVPYLTMAEVEDSLLHAIRTGHEIDDITCWVRTESDADKLFAIMDAHARLANVHGSRARIFGL